MMMNKKGLMKQVAMKALGSLEGLDASNVKAVSIIFQGNKQKGMMKEEDEEEYEDSCPECGCPMEGEEECPECGYEESKPSKEEKQLKSVKRVEEEEMEEED